MGFIDRLRGYATSTRQQAPATSREAKPADKPKTPMGEMAFADPLRLSTLGVSEPYNPSVLITRKGYGVVDEMKRDEQVKAALTFKKYAVLAAGWDVCSPEGKPDDWEPKVFAERMLKRLEGSFAKTMLGILSGLDYGFSVSEKVWDEIDGKIMLKALKTREPSPWTFKQDPYGNLVSLKQHNKELPVEKFVVFTWDGDFSNLYGKTDLEATYRAWWLKRNAYTWMSMLLERMGIPPIFALYNTADYPNNKVAQLNEVMKKLQAATTGVIPRGDKDSIELWSPELAGQVSSVFIPALEWLDQQIARSLLMPGLIGMGGDKGDTGSFARATVQFDVFMLVLEYLRTEMAALVQEQIIDPAIVLNYGMMQDDEKPKFEFRPLTDQARADVLTAWQALVNGKVVRPQDADEAYIRESLGFPEASEEDQKKRAEADVETAAAAVEANAKAQAAGMPEGTTPGQGGNKPGTKEFTLTDEQFNELLARLVPDDADA